MANQNYFFLVFPEYDDKDNIRTTQEWVTTDIPNADSYGKWLKHIKVFREFYNDEECEIVIDSLNVKACLYFVLQMPDVYPNRLREFRSLLKGVQDWRKHRTSNPEVPCVIFHNRIYDEIRCEVASRMVKNPNDSFLIVVHSNGYQEKSWSVEMSGESLELESLPLSIFSVFNWLSNHHKPRRMYSWNKKHGENGMNSTSNKEEEVSLLLSSKEHASDLLPKAIGIEGFDELHIYDEDYGAFMEYKAETKKRSLPENAAERVYHSYHISEEHEKDIKPRVRWKMNLLKDGE